MFVCLHSSALGAPVGCCSQIVIADGTAALAGAPPRANLDDKPAHDPEGRHRKKQRDQFEEGRAGAQNPSLTFAGGRCDYAASKVVIKIVGVVLRVERQDIVAAFLLPEKVSSIGRGRISNLSGYGGRIGRPVRDGDQQRIRSGHRVHDHTMARLTGKRRRVPLPAKAVHSSIGQPPHDAQHGAKQKREDRRHIKRPPEKTAHKRDDIKPNATAQRQIEDCRRLRSADATSSNP